MELNVDAGELPDEPAELYALAHRVNVACGGHAGDPASMRRACQLAREGGAAVGAHPSYPDREHFGRRSVPIDRAALVAAVRAQCEALCTSAGEVGVTVGHVKLHGALYHDADADEGLALALVDAACEALGAPDVIARPGGATERAAHERGLRVLREGYADRGYDLDGNLLPRGVEGALLRDLDAVLSQCRELAASGRYDTLCVHGDGPSALEFAKGVRALLTST